jgi:quercetin dioxygenase-like cupin family protein
MTHIARGDLISEVEIQQGAIVSKVIHRDDALNVTTFGFDTGQELTEHRSPRHAIVEVLSGRLAFTVDGEELDAGPGFWLHMDPDAPHSLVAREPTVMLLTLDRS